MRYAALLLFLIFSSASVSQPVDCTTTINKKATTRPASGQSLPTVAASPAIIGGAATISTTGNHGGGIKDKLDIVETLFKILAYILGSLWVYFNYFQGRTYKPRLEIKLTGARLNTPHDGLFKIVVLVKNVGLAKVELKDHGTGIRIFGYDATKNVDNWIHIGTYAILTPYHQWIEPGETIEDSILIPIEPTTFAAVRANLNLNSIKVTWKVAAIM